MVTQRGKLPLEPKVEQKAAHGQVQAIQATIGPVTTPLRGYQVAIGSDDVRVTHHHLCRPRSTGDGTHAARGAMVDQNFVYPFVVDDCSAKFFEQPYQRSHQCVRATEHIVHSADLLEIRHDGIDAGRRQGIPSDEQWMKAEQHAQARIAEIPGGQGIHRTVCA